MAEIFLGFSKPKSKFPIYSWAIRLIEKTPYSHVFVRIPSDSLGVSLIYQASGVQVNFMGEKCFEDAVHIFGEFAFEISEESRTAFLKWAAKEEGSPYGLKAVLGILLVKCFNLHTNPFSDGRKTWFCSELAGAILRDFIGADVSGEDLELMGPKRIFELCAEIKLGGQWRQQ